MRVIGRVGAAIFCVLLLAACTTTIRGSGQILERDIQVKPFHKLVVNADYEVTIKPGSKPSLHFKFDNNLADAIDIDETDGTLILKLDSGINVEGASLQAIVETPTLTGLELNSNASVTIDSPLQSPKLDIDVNGGGRVSGPISVTTLGVSTTGSPQIELTGTAQTANIDAIGSGDFKLSGLAIEALAINLSGSVSAAVNVTQAMSVSIKGTSDLTYSGSPQITSQSIVGSAKLTKSG